MEISLRAQTILDFIQEALEDLANELQLNYQQVTVSLSVTVNQPVHVRR